MIDQMRMFRNSLAPCLLVGLCVMPGTAAAQPPPKEYRQTFKGSPKNPKEFFFMGPDAETHVKFEAEGLRLKLPAGHPSGADTGLMTRFGVQGDFEITLKYEVLREPEPNDAGGQTHFSLYVIQDTTKQYRASINRRWTGGPPEFLTWMEVPGLTPGKSDTRVDTIPAPAKTGKLRLTRHGTELSYFAAEGDDASFKLLQKYAFGAGNLRNVRIVAATGGPKAALDVRVTDFVIRAGAFPRLDKIAANEAKPRQKDAPTYHEPFKGQPQKREDFVLIGKDAGTQVKFEPEGLRITLPAGAPAWQPTGVATAFGVAGDFEATVRYEILAEPEPADAGSTGTQISLTANVGGVNINDASIRRKVLPFRPAHVRLNTSAEKLTDYFPVKEKAGRLRMVRTGDLIAYYLSEGLDGEFKLLTTHPFDAADVKEIQLSAQTTGPRAALDVRFTDLQIRAAALVRRPKYAVEYRELFKGPPENPKDFVLTGPDAEDWVKFEPEGLRITLPAGDPGTLKSTGVMAGFAVRGDFEMTLSFEVLAEPTQLTNLRLSVSLDRPNPRPNEAFIYRGTVPELVKTVNGLEKGFDHYQIGMILPDDKNPKKTVTKYNAFGAKGKRIRFRLARVGADVSYFVAEGAAGEFQLLDRFTYGAEHVRDVAILAATDGKASFDVRVTELLIRAAALPRLLTGPKQRGQTFREAFKGPPQKREDFVLIGTNADKYVKFEPEGLRITLPAGKTNAQATGVATALSVVGNLDISVRYEILTEPEPADAGAPKLGTRIYLTTNVGGVNFDAAGKRRKVPAFGIVHLPAQDADKLGNIFPVKEKTGRFRMVRLGENVSFYLSEGLDKEFKLLTTYRYGGDNLPNVQIFGQTSGPTTALDVRFSDLRISALVLYPRQSQPKIEKDSEPKIPTKDYAQTYEQSFKGNGAKPAGWEFSAPAAEEFVQFEPTGLRLTMAAGWPGERRSAGIQSTFGAKGDFEITLNFEYLKEPAPSDEGKFATRLLMGIALDTPNFDTPTGEVATLNRSLSIKGDRSFTTWMRNGENPKGALGGRPTTGTTGRLRLVRSGDDLFCLVSMGADQPLTLIRKYRFGSENLKRVGITGATGNDKSMLDVRITDFRLRADAILRAPAAGAAGEPQPPQPPGAGQKDGGGHGWLVAGLLVGAAVAFLGVFAVGAWFFVRNRGNAVGETAKDAAKTPISFPCSKCGKVVKAKAALAGKKVKCARCGAAVLVPSIQAGEPRDASR